VKRHDPEPDDPPHSYQTRWNRKDSEDMSGGTVFHV
jgi:hypothetical protein